MKQASTLLFLGAIDETSSLCVSICRHASLLTHSSWFYSRLTPSLSRYGDNCRVTSDTGTKNHFEVALVTLTVWSAHSKLLKAHRKQSIMQNACN